jgi:PhoPQ-activated pathogenicity-related protein
VRAIIPIVYDNLKLSAQMPRQLSLWGQYSEEIQEYTRRGLQQQMSSRRGRQLARIIDPWFYRDRLKMPKLLINGANDQYWATDATSLYWDDLQGEKSLLYVPNSGHKLEDRTRVLATAIAFFQHVAGSTDFPRLTFTHAASGEKRSLRIQSNIKPTEARLWTARSDSTDFRGSKWESTPMKADGDGYGGEVTVPEKGGVAWFGELVFPGPMGNYTLSTPCRVAPDPVSRNSPPEPRAARTPSPRRRPGRAG